MTCGGKAWVSYMLARTILLIGFLIGLHSPLLRCFCCIVQFCGTIVSPHQPNASFIFS